MNPELPAFECQGCGARLTQEPEGQPRKPCPHCGETGRSFSLTFQAEVRTSGRSVAHRPPTDALDEREAVRIVGSGSRSASADIESLTSASYETSGDAPRGEEGALETARILIEKLRESDTGWSQPNMVDVADVDCESRNGDGVLAMQVTRVPRSSSFWRDLGRHATARGDGSVDDLANELMTAISHKASRLPTDQRANLALVLDARDTPAFAMVSTAARFSELHGPDAAALGFRSVWVVGPTANLVRQLA